MTVMGRNVLDISRIICPTFVQVFFAIPIDLRLDILIFEAGFDTSPAIHELCT